MGDWFHIFFVSGIFNVELALLMRVLAQIPGANFGWESLQAFCENFIWPKASKTPHQAFQNPVGETGVFTGQGSACLNLYPVLRLYLISCVMPLGLMLDVCECMLALCLVCDVLILISSNRTTPLSLEEALFDHATKFNNAYRVLLHRYLPKHHVARHLAEWWEKFGILVSLFTHERKHKFIKAEVKDRKTLQAFSRGVIENLTIRHLQALMRPLWHCGLEGESEACEEIASRVRYLYPNADRIMTSRVAVSGHKTYTAGDFAFVTCGMDVRLGEIWFHVQVDNLAPMTGICIYADVPAGSTEYIFRASPSDDPVLVPSDDLVNVAIYRKLASGDIMALKPAELR